MTTIAVPRSCVSLARYAEILEIGECAFWGVNAPNAAPEPCDHIWTQAERNRVARYLAEAQEEIEQVTGYPLCPRWFADEQHYYTCPIHTKWTKVIEAGVQAESVIQACAAVDHTNDPSVVGPLATTVTDVDEIHIYHPDTDIEITPSDITITGGNVTITIPRCRLVTIEASAAEVDYNDIGTCIGSVVTQASFECCVDVVRVYNDPTDQAELVWPHRSSEYGCSNACPSCGEFTHAACAYIRNPLTGAVDVLKASLSNGVLTAESCACGCRHPQLVRVNYRAGMDPTTLQAEDAVIRLAHSKMPFAPCGCSVVQDAWKRDTFVPDVLDALRLQCPFGLSQGAWVSWKFANAMKQPRVRVL